MTVSRTDIQELIAEVDQLLWTTDATDSDLLIEPAQYQAVLEKVRWCLSNLARQVEVPNLEAVPLDPPEQQTASAIAQAVMAQMNLQRQDWLQPMQLELETVRQQRETLRREIQHLETQQRQMSHELLQTVMHRCSEALKHELATVFERWQAQFNPQQLSQPANPVIAGTPNPGNAPPALQQLDWLEKLRSLEQQADQLFLSLDQTFHQVFQSLEQDVQSYHQSLRHKLGQIHELQNQTLLASVNPAGSRPQTSAALPSNTVAAELAWRSPDADMPLLQLDQGEPLPALEPRMMGDSRGELTGELREPREQMLQLDLQVNAFHADVPHSPQTQTVSSDQAWEAWDEYLFTYDPGQDVPLSVPDLPRVLTVEQAKPTPPPSITQSSQAQHATLEHTTPQDISPQNTPLEPSELEPAADLPQEVQQELFANLGDPATVTEPPPDGAPVAPPDATLSAGTVLFGDPVIDPETAAIATDDLAAALDSSPETKTADPQGPSLEETIASLDELLEQVSAHMTDQPVVADLRTTDAELEKDTIPPGETLLATAEVTAQPSGKLDTVLDEQKLDQLAADLARFETEAPAQASVSEQTDSSATIATEPDASEPSAAEPDAPELNASEPNLAESTMTAPMATSAMATPVVVPSPSTVQADPPPTASASETVAAADAPIETIIDGVVQDMTELPDLKELPLPEELTDQAAGVAIAPPNRTAVEMSEPSSDEASPSLSDATASDAVVSDVAADTTHALPAAVVFTSLSELNWTAAVDAPATLTDAQGDLWGEQQRPPVQNAAGQNS